MLTSFSIKNFRLFSRLQVNHLGRVNLIVGRNNSGKTALLEALELYSTNGSGKVIFDLLTKRQETWTSQTSAAGQRFAVNPIRHLFYNHELPKLGQEGISLGTSLDSKDALQLRLGAFQIEEGSDGIRRSIPVQNQEALDNFPDLEFALVAFEDGKTRTLFRLDRDLNDGARNFERNASLLAIKSKFNLQVVPTKNMTESKLAELWDSINLTGLDDEVVLGLKLLDQRITGVAFVDNKPLRGGGGRVPLVKLDHIQEPLPLRSMGDGITRLFHIIIALVNAQNGILLVDEFENGLHWSVQSDVWEKVFQLSERLNVQVFATTHSRDCIYGFESAWQKYPNYGSFFRINSDPGESTSVTKYSIETLSDAIETNVEVR